MSMKLKLIRQLIELLPEDDVTTYPRLNFKLKRKDYASPIFMEENEVAEDNTAAKSKIGKYSFSIPKFISKTLTLPGTNNQTITLTYTEPGKSPITVTSTSVDQEFNVQFGTEWRATVSGTTEYNVGTLSASSGKIKEDTVISITEASLKTYTLTLAGTINQVVILNYTEPNGVTVTKTSTNNNQIFTVIHGTTWTATVESNIEYNAGELSSTSGTVTSDTTVSVTTAFLKTYTLTLTGTTNQTITLKYTEPNSSEVTRTSTGSNQNFTVKYGTTWTATVAGAEGYDPGTLSATLGTVTGNTTVSASEATVAALVLTNSNYKMSQIYPSTYQTMTTILDVLDTSNLTNMNDMFSNCRALTTIPQLDTSNATSMSNMFKDCSSLSSTFTWAIDCSSIMYFWDMYYMFKNSSVTEVTLANVSDSIKSDITSRNLKGDDTLTINFVNIPNYRMTTIYPSTYSTMTNIDISTIKTEYPSILDNLTTTANMFNNCNKLTTIDNMNQLDTSNVTRMNSMFMNCTSLTTIPKLNTSNVTNMNDMFQFCTNLTSIPQLDTSNVTTMRYTFFKCSSLTSIPQLNTSKVTDMGGIFKDCSSLESIPQLDTSKVICISSMFNNCTSLTSIPELNTSNANDMNGMFENCTSLTSIPHLDTSKVTNMNFMFSGCTKLTTIPTLDTSSADDMNSMFSGCTKLTSIPQLNTSNVINMNSMFKNCSSLPSTFPWTIDCSSISDANNLSKMFEDSSVTNVTLANVGNSIKSQITSQLLKGDNTLTINFAKVLSQPNYYRIKDVYPDTYDTMTTVPDILDTSNLTSAQQMFVECANLTTIPQLDTSNIDGMNMMFTDCTNLTTIPQMDTSNVTGMMMMFQNCSSLPFEFPWIIDCSSITMSFLMTSMFSGSSVTSVTLANVDDSIKSEITSQLLKNNDTLTINFINVPNYQMRIIYPSTYTTIDSIDISTIKTQYPDIFNNLVCTNNMFYNCNALTTISNANQLDTSKVTGMSQMFYNCSNLTSIPQLDTSNVIIMNGMFCGCGSLTVIPQLDTSKVTQAERLFSGTKITTIPSMDFSNATVVEAMFDGCTQLQSTPQINISKATVSRQMFKNCTSLTTIPELDTSNITKMRNMFENCTSLPATFPWVINMEKVDASYNDGYSNMFTGSSVTKVRVRRTAHDLVENKMKSGGITIEYVS